MTIEAGLLGGEAVEAGLDWREDVGDLGAGLRISRPSPQQKIGVMPCDRRP
jgi:hypothetical protein